MSISSSSSSSSSPLFGRVLRCVLLTANGSSSSSTSCVFGIIGIGFCPSSLGALTSVISAILSSDEVPMNSDIQSSSSPSSSPFFFFLGPLIPVDITIRATIHDNIVKPAIAQTITYGGSVNPGSITRGSKGGASCSS